MYITKYNYIKPWCKSIVSSIYITRNAIFLINKLRLEWLSIKLTWLWSRKCATVVSLRGSLLTIEQGKGGALHSRIHIDYVFARKRTYVRRQYLRHPSVEGNGLPLSFHRKLFFPFAFQFSRIIICFCLRYMPTVLQICCITIDLSNSFVYFVSC